METPPGQRTLQKHLPTARVHCLAKFDRATLFEPIGERSLRIARTRNHDKTTPTIKGQSDTTASEHPVGGEESQRQQGSRKR